MNDFALAHTAPPPLVMFEDNVRRALEEDLGRAGDITTNATVPADKQSRAIIAARKDGIVSGLIAAACAFRLIDPAVHVTPRVADGGRVEAGGVIAQLEGPARALLTGERVALNYLGHLSGVATATNALVEETKGTKARITCTRKTLPGLRALQKYAVRCGGGVNHRFGLDDAVLIKDNHIVAAGGIEAALGALRNRLGHMVKVEVEVDTLEQLQIVLNLGVDTILLDNMSPETMREAVSLTAGRAVLEASGNVTLASVRAIALSGVDYISSGALTHSAISLDLGLDF